MYEEVWGGYQPQPWGYDVIFTPQVTLTYQIWGQLGLCNSMRVQPYSLETAYQCSIFIYIEYGCMKRFEVAIGLCRDIMTSFSLLKWRWHPISEANLACVTVYGCNHTHLRQRTNGWRTLYISNMDVWRGLRRVSASAMTLWRHFYSSSDPDIPTMRPTWPV
jgi:hypothetical protein